MSKPDYVAERDVIVLTAERSDERTEPRYPATREQATVLVAGMEPGTAHVSRVAVAGGFTIRAVSDTTETINRAHELVPDVIVAPVLGPGLSGFEMCRELRSSDRFDGTRIVLISPFTVEDEDIASARRVGATGVVSAATSRDELLRLLDGDGALCTTDPKVPAVHEHGEYLARHLTAAGASIGVPDQVLEAACAQFDRMLDAAGAAEKGDVDAIAAGVSAVVQLTAASRGVFYEFGPDGWTAVACRGYRAARLPHSYRHLALLEEAAATLQVVYREPGAEPADTSRRILAANSCTSVAVVPVHREGTITGALLVARAGSLRPWQCFLQWTATRLGAALGKASPRVSLLETVHDARNPTVRRPTSAIAERLLELEDEGRTAAVIVLALDRLSALAWIAGEDVADLTRAVRERLQTANVAKVDVVVQERPEEVAIVIADAGDEAAAHTAAAEVITCLQDPLRVAGWNLYLGATAGVALFPDHGADADLLVARATAAMRRTQTGLSDIGTYSPEWAVASPTHVALEQALRGQLAGVDRGLTLHFQPKIGLPSMRCHEVEALLRCDHATLGHVLPGELLPAAEDARLMLGLGRWVLERAAAQTAAWWRAGFMTRTAINVDSRQLLDGGLTNWINEALARWQLPAEALELEVTETAALVDLTTASDVLANVRELGVTVALDDFGTGYSSLEHLRQLPVDVVKIDRSFVVASANDRRSHTILSAVVDLAHDLDQTVVAEGVETPEQLEMLLRLGCDTAQGYLFSPAVPSELVPSFITPAPRSHRS